MDYVLSDTVYSTIIIIVSTRVRGAGSRKGSGSTQMDFTNVLEVVVPMLALLASFVGVGWAVVSSVNRRIDTAVADLRQDREYDRREFRELLEASRTEQRDLLNSIRTEAQANRQEDRQHFDKSQDELRANR